MCLLPGAFMTRSVPILAVLGVAALASPAVLGEGAVKLLDCEIARICDDAGECRAGFGRVRFRMEPIELGAGGTGRYTISYNDTRTGMQALSDAGPFVWNTELERNALIASSADRWLWHHLRLDRLATPEIRFLDCTFQQ